MSTADQNTIVDTNASIDAKCRSIFSAGALAFAGTAALCFALSLALPSDRVPSGALLPIGLIGVGGVSACCAGMLAKAARHARSLRDAVRAARSVASQSERALETLSAVVCRCDASGAILEASAAFAALARCELSQMRGKLLADVFDSADAKSDLAGLLRAAFAGKATVGMTCEIRLPNRSVRIIEADFNLLRGLDGSVESVVFCGWDVTERERAMQILREHSEETQSLIEQQRSHLQETEGRLEELTTVDTVTQLKNHRSFQERLREELRRSRIDRSALSLLKINIDGFKRYNESYGHSAGDAVLSELGATLTESLRGSDFAARYGGDDFVVLLPETDYLGALEAAERMRSAVEAAPWQHQAVTIGIGAATLSSRVRRRADFLALADAAMRCAKQLGPNQVIHAHDLPPKRPAPTPSAIASQILIAA